MNQINWQALRKDFPALERYHYFYTASGGPIPRPVYDAGAGYYRGMLEQGDALWEENVNRREEIRRQVASFINAEPAEVEFIPSLSVGMNIVADLLWERGQVIACPLEFPSTTLPWLHRRPAGLTWVQPETAGEVPPEKMLAARRGDRGVLLTSHVQYSNGYRQDLERLGKDKDDFYLVVNASQSLGAFQIDVKGMGIDVLCSNSYKWLLGGYGCGILYVSRRILEVEKGALMAGWFGVQDRDALLNDRYRLLDEAARFNPGSPSFPTIFSLGAAVAYLQSIGPARIEQRVLELNRHLTAQLRQAGFTILSPLGKESYRSAATLVELKRPRETVIELEHRRMLCTIKPEGMRVATHFFLTFEEIDQLVEQLREIEGP